MKKLQILKKSDFLNFIGVERFSKFFILKLLDSLEDYKFYLANKNIKLTDEYDPEDIEEIGPGFIKTEFSKESIFDYVLQGLGFRAVITQNIPHLAPYDWIINEGIKELGFNLNNAIIAIKEKSAIIIFENEVYYYGLDITSIILNIRKLAEIFMNKHKNKVLIPHEEYITILLDLLPGKITFRQLK